MFSIMTNASAEEAKAEVHRSTERTLLVAEDSPITHD